jgi:hypothetical protein
LGEILGIAIRPCAVLAVYSFSLGPGMGEVAGRGKARQAMHTGSTG